MGLCCSPPVIRLSHRSDGEPELGLALLSFSGPWFLQAVFYHCVEPDRRDGGFVFFVAFFFLL